MDGWLGVVIMIGLGVGFAAVMIGLSVLLGPKNRVRRVIVRPNSARPARKKGRGR